MSAYPDQLPLQTDMVIRNIGQLVTMAQQPIIGATGPLQVISDAAMAMHHGRIVWIGPDDDAGPLFQHNTGVHKDGINDVDAQGAVITPGLVDSHTHLVFAGDRAEEFHLRRAGVSYGELLSQGRGILSTVNATRHTNTTLLTELATARLDVMRHYGTTTVEVKTGYGLDKITEEACLRIINNLSAPIHADFTCPPGRIADALLGLRIPSTNDALASSSAQVLGKESSTSGQAACKENALESSPVYPHSSLRVVPTFLGAHTLPPEYRDRRPAYVDLVVEEMLPSFVGLARFCDVFCEREAFTLAESRRILTRAKDLGYQLKIHADQLSPSGGARLAAELGATSADHLDYASDADLDAMREAGVVATLLPGCSYTLRTPYPSARRFLDAGLHVALATDFNPGTSYCENMQMIVGLAMSAMGMTLEEALMAVTINGARALALQEQIGSIEVGKYCELALWSISDYREIGYHFGSNLVQSVLVQNFPR